MSDGLVTPVGLFYGIAAGPSKAGNREDGKICTAQPGECRFNSKFYTLGMRDAKSWSDPCADDTCSASCPYLQDKPRDMGPEDERRERALRLVQNLVNKQERDRQQASLWLGTLGTNPHEE